MRQMRQMQMGTKKKTSKSRSISIEAVREARRKLVMVTTQQTSTNDNKPNKACKRRWVERGRS